MRKRITVPLATAMVCAALAQGEAFAQPRGDQMRDPMRPPDASASAGAQTRTSGLQAVITSPTRKLAVIDGAVVAVGAPVRDAKLSGVSDSLAVIDKDGDRDVLLMHPNVDKKPTRRSAPK